MVVAMAPMMRRTDWAGAASTGDEVVDIRQIPGGCLTSNQALAKE